MLAVNFVLALGFSFLISLLLTPSVIRLAPLVGAVDEPNERKVHKKAVPRFGGIAIFASLGATLILFLNLQGTSLASSWLVSQRGLAVFLGMTLMLGLGIWDDIFGLRASKKFLVQLLVASLMYFAGIRISSMSIPLVAGHFSLGILDFPITILWITGVTNAFNLIDGLDGLASGIALIAFVTIVPISVLRHDASSVLLALVLAGAVLGFLRYNFNPAKIFLGDSGSLLLGFSLATISILGSTKGSAAFAVVVPLLVLGLPIMETFLSMARRFLRSFLPGQPSQHSILGKLNSMFQPDRGHIHHRLLDQGFTHRKAVLTLYSVSCVLGLGAFLVTVGNNVTASLILTVVGVAIAIGVGKLRYKEMSILHNGILLPLYDKPILNQESFQVFFDAAFIAGSFVLSSVLIEGSRRVFVVDSLLPGTLVLGIQLGAFWISGVYKRSTRIVGLNDVLTMVKSVLFSVAATAFGVVTFPHAFSSISSVTLVLDFFFLLSFVLVFRTSFFVLKFLFRQETRTGRKVLIYGANVDGLWMLEKILNMEYAGFIPIGFIDDDPNLEGKRFNGYPVFGGHWKLQRLSHRLKIDEVVVCNELIKPEVLKRMRTLCREAKITLTKSRLVFEDFGFSHDEKKLNESIPLKQSSHPRYSLDIGNSVERNIGVAASAPL